MKPMMIIQSQCSMFNPPVAWMPLVTEPPVRSPAARRDPASPLAQLSKPRRRNCKGCGVSIDARTDARRRCGARSMAKGMMHVGITLVAAVVAASAWAGKPQRVATPPQATVHPAIWPAAHWPFARNPNMEARVRAILARMSVADKVGQLIQANISTATPADIRKYHLGSVLATGNSGPNGQQFGTPQQWLATADAYHRASIDTRDGNAGIPVLFGFDAVHGANKIVGATLFPHNIGLGATRDPALVRSIGAATAKEMRAAGVTWAFAPTLAVPQDLRWGRTYEGYGERPALVARYARAAIEGLQGTPGSADFLDATRVAATAKHFIGGGATRNGVDPGDITLGERRLRDVAAAPFVAAIDAGVQAVMVSLARWRGVPMLGQRDLLTGVLKGRMHFGGIVLGDFNAQSGLSGCSAVDCSRAIDSGADMLMAPYHWRTLYANTLRDVQAGKIPMARLDDAVARILRVKLRLGLFDAAAPAGQGVKGRFDLIGSAAHRALARRAVRESLVLLKNSGRLLPLEPRQTVLVAGEGADNLAMQSGGWTLDWQGDHLTRADFPGATSIWAGLRTQIEATGGHAELSVDGWFTRKPDVAIVVFGEDPYAEFAGDLKSLTYKHGQHDLRLLQALHAKGIPVVAVFLSGRPLYVTPELDSADAFVAAWLPGSEGEGVADMLLRAPDGSIRHDFVGRLPYAWPRTAAQGPRSTRENGAALFPFGYGLTYRGAQAPNAFAPQARR
jgi:beta-glucosidase